MTITIPLKQMAVPMMVSLALMAPTTHAQDATVHTAEANRAVLDSLPFDDRSDFERATRGLIATPEQNEITDANGKVVYDLDQFEFLEGTEAPDTANPSLWRQGHLNQLSGLFEVTDDIYQIRGYDLSVMSFIRGDEGWIVIDPLLSVDTARAGFKLLRDNVEDLPVSAVIFTHSHADHFGGVKGIISEQEVEERNVPIIAPEGFYEESVGENLIAGNAMSRRASYMFGNLLPTGPEGSIGAGLGPITSAGNITIMRPTRTISGPPGEPIETTVDGVNITFLNTPGAEAPAELMFYLPDSKALMQAEEINHTLHNLYTLRGAKVRSGDQWAKYINQVINLYGDEVEISFGSHHWPVWGNEEINEFWRKQRDTYRYIHDETLRLANKGQTMDEIAENVKLPDTLSSEFANRGYYGTVSHNAKAQYQLYFGWFSGNPSELNPLPPAEEGRKFVEYAGGADALISKARDDYEAGNYRWAATALNHLVFAEPDNEAAKDLLADTLTQMGYQSESGPWRNFYLTGAKELRDGVSSDLAPNAASADIILGLPLDKYLDYLAMRLDHPRAAKAGVDMTLNLVMPDAGDEVTLSIANGVMNYTMDTQADDADATVTMDRAVLDAINLQQRTFPDAIQSGDVAIEGDQKAFLTFLGLLDSFEFGFNIVTP
ncbi:alkyl/aryl-sulfatase [Marinobacter sp. LN3S78]|uniref:alkyl/aryl-sulfatase n=1 Tax=Marinobacter sp. LN3S78 TaxID=3382300 RepID=UPI00387B4B10